MLCLHGVEYCIVVEVGRYGIGAGIVSHIAVEVILCLLLGDDGSDIACIRAPCLLMCVGHFVAEHHEGLHLRILVVDKLLYLLNVLAYYESM